MLDAIVLFSGDCQVMSKQEIVVSVDAARERVRNRGQPLIGMAFVNRAKDGLKADARQCLHLLP